MEKVCQCARLPLEGTIDQGPVPEVSSNEKDLALSPSADHFSIPALLSTIIFLPVMRLLLTSMYINDTRDMIYALLYTSKMQLGGTQLALHSLNVSLEEKEKDILKIFLFQHRNA